MSAFGGKADILVTCLRCLLLTQSRHCLASQLEVEEFATTEEGADLVEALGARPGQSQAEQNTTG